MAEFPYCTNATSVRRFMEMIQNAAVPRRVGPKYMEGLGFRGNDGRSLSGILKTLGFLSANGVPTPEWQAYRDRVAGRQALARALREAYGELFEAYPDAHHKEDEVLSAFFGSQSTVAASTVTYMVRTFRTLCNLADFDGKAPSPETNGRTFETVGVEAVDDPPCRDVTLNVTLQLQLPVTDDPLVYEALFSALRKHLLK